MKKAQEEDAKQRLQWEIQRQQERDKLKQDRLTSPIIYNYR